jgi:hypothetical protein
MRRRLVLTVVAIVGGTFLSTLVASPAAAALRRVEISVAADMVDNEWWPAPDELCYVYGKASFDISDGDGPVTFGTGGFRDLSGSWASYFCGDEVSVCFSSAAAVTGSPIPSTVELSADGTFTVRMRITWYEADGVQVRCPWWNWYATRLVVLTVTPDDEVVCRDNVTHANNDGDSVALRICVTNVGPVAHLAQLPPAPAIGQFDCEATGATAYGCDMAFTAPGGEPTVEWFVNDQAVNAFRNRTTVTGTCTRNATVRVRVHVTDRRGQSTSGSTSFRCTVL